MNIAVNAFWRVALFLTISAFSDRLFFVAGFRNMSIVHCSTMGRIPWEE